SVANTPKIRPSNTTTGPPTARGAKKHSDQDVGEQAKVLAERSSVLPRESQSGNDDWLAAVKCSIKDVRTLPKRLLIASTDLGARSANTPSYMTHGGHFMYYNVPQYRTPMVEGPGATSSAD
ncbi:hypothetical protein LPJ73_002378, partial [Coemansia sp. RSA 2703]